jgi:hypothetical protein
MHILRRSRSKPATVVPAFTCPSGQISARTETLRSSAQIDPHLSTLTIHRHFRAHVRARVRGYSRSLCPTPARLSTLELRTTTRDPRSRTCSVTSFDAVVFRLPHLRMPRPAGLSTSRNSAPFEHRASRDVEHLSISKTFRPQSSCDAA